MAANVIISFKNSNQLVVILSVSKDWKLSVMKVVLVIEIQSPKRQ